MSAHISNGSETHRHPAAFRATTSAERAIISGAGFGIYAVTELIGVGHTASVYRAHDHRLLREVALKVLNAGALPNPDGLSRLLHEARMAAAIRHPNVVSIFDVGVHDGMPFIAMELLSGEDLELRLKTARVLPEPALIDMAVQLASGLGAVHDAGIVHRDLRPSNVFLARGPDGALQPKLLDFGLSKQLRDHLRLTTGGRRGGVPLYTAPEVLLGGEATFLSDQYSLGVLLYECATGVQPFRAATIRESVELITAGQARPIAEQPIRPSRRLAAIIERAMSFDPGRRFADMRELVRSLASLSGRRAPWPWGAASGPAPTSAPPRQRAKPRQATPAPPSTGRRALIAAVIGCSVAAPLWAWRSARQQPAAAPLGVASGPAPAAPPQPSAVPARPGAAHRPAGSTAPAAPTAPAPPPPAPTPAGAPIALAASTPSLLAPGAEGVLTAPLVAPPPPAPEPLATEGAGDAGAAPAGGEETGEEAEGEASLQEPSGAPSPSSQDRGTNGALIFD